MQSRRLDRRVSKLVWSVRGNVDGRTRSEGLLSAAKREFQFTLKDRECLLEIVAMRRRSSSRRNMHINEAKLSRSVFPAKEDGVGIPNNPDVRQRLIGLRLGNCESAVEVVRGNWRTGIHGRIRFTMHRCSPLLYLVGSSRRRMRRFASPSIFYVWFPSGPFTARTLIAQQSFGLLLILSPTSFPLRIERCVARREVRRRKWKRREGFDRGAQRWF